MPEDPEVSPEAAKEGSLVRAWRIQENAAQVGFDWPDVAGPLEKVHEEAREVAEALARGDRQHAARELGDLLFAVVNVARFLPAEPAEALHGCCDRFEARLDRVRAAVAREGKAMTSCTLEELDRHWESAKVVAPQEPKQGG